MLTKITKLEVHKTCDKIGITPPENGNRNGPDLVQAFQKKWWVESRFYGAPNLPLPLRHKSTSGGNQHRYADVKIGKVETKHQEELQKTIFNDGSRRY